jgi:hypothetical protein
MQVVRLPESAMRSAAEDAETGRLLLARLLFARLASQHVPARQCRPKGNARWNLS